MGDEKKGRVSWVLIGEVRRECKGQGTWRDSYQSGI